MAGIAHASWSVFWDGRRKCWILIERSEVAPTRTYRLESEVPLTQVEVGTITAAVKMALLALLNG